MDSSTHVGAARVVNFPTPSTLRSQTGPNSYLMAEDEQRMKLQAEKKPRKKHFPVEAVLRRDLNMCSKDGDVLRALEIYDRSVADKAVQWNQYHFNVLLYLCSSAALGSITVRKSGNDKVDGERLNLQPVGQTLNTDGSVEFMKGAKSDHQKPGEATHEDGASTTIAIAVSPEHMELAARRGFEIFEDMKRLKVPLNEATLTAVARLAIYREDGDLAFQMVKEMEALKITPKLRSYSPAIVTYCKKKSVEKAFEVDAHMQAAGVAPEEPELGALLKLCVELQLEKEVYSLLHRIRGRVRALAPSTVATIKDWFSSPGGTFAGRSSEQPSSTAIKYAVEAGGGGWHGLGWVGEGKWTMKWATIDSEGCCLCCKKNLVTIDLDPLETENFAKSVADLAFARESKHNGFKQFQEWLEHHGPFDAIIDGANVGLFNQNFAQGGFNFHQLNAVARTAEDQQSVTKTPLIILHQARTKVGAANTPQAQKLLQKWRSTNSLYTTPNGSNDDWYWLYAAVKNKCLLITNDEMRDHLLQLLGDDFFPRWKERHQVHFSSTSRGIRLHLPPPYSIVIQESEDGSWHIPKSRDDDIGNPHEWLCITRPHLSSNGIEVPSCSSTEHGEHANGQALHEMDNIVGKDSKVVIRGPKSLEIDDTNTSPRFQKRPRLS